jgi:hypothetical protein
MAFRNEIDLAQTRLLERGCPRELFERYFSRVRNIASATVLPQEWRQHKSGLPTDVRLAIAWAAWVSPDEEKELSPDGWSALMDELDGIDQSIESSRLSDMYATSFRDRSTRSVLRFVSTRSPALRR